MLISYFATLLNLFSSNSFMVKSYLGFSMYKTMLSENRDNLTSSFQLYFFSCLRALARTSSTMFSTNGENGHPYLFSDLKGKSLQLFALNNCGFVLYGLYCLKVYSFNIWFIDSFYFKRILNFVNVFPVPNERI